MRQLKITKQVTNRETASLDKYLQEIGKVDLITEDEEVEYLSHIAPNVEKDLIIRLVRAANDLRADYQKGYLPKPLSTKGLVNVVEHLNEYPDDPTKKVFKIIKRTKLGHNSRLNALMWVGLEFSADARLKIHHLREMNNSVK